MAALAALFAILAVLGFARAALFPASAVLAVSVIEAAAAACCLLAAAVAP